MTDHPLTDEICRQITWDVRPKISDEDDMRAAADWQLEQVIEWLKDNVGMLILCTESEVATRYLDSLEKEFIQNFIETMRPQEDN